MTTKRFSVDDGLEDVLCWEINDKENGNMTCGECANLLNKLSDENEQLKHRLAISEKANFVTALEQENNKLKKELDYWKKRALLLENKYDERDSVKWLRDNTVWEQMPTNIKTISNTSNDTRNKVELEDIIGLVKTDEPTNSVELKKELYK